MRKTKLGIERTYLAFAMRSEQGLSLHVGMRIFTRRLGVKDSLESSEKSPELRSDSVVTPLLESGISPEAIDLN